MGDDRPEPSQAAPMGRLASMAALVGRYVGVGALVTGVDYLVFLLGLHLGLSAAWANVVGRVVATGVGALLHRHYTFSGPQRLSWPRQMVAYGALSTFNLGLSTALILMWVDHVGLGPVAAKILTDVVVIAVSVVIGRLFIFAPAR